MAFFARPNLDNTQFKQLKGSTAVPSTLTLSGQTQIATTSGLTLIGDAGTGPAAYGGMYIPIIATGASNNFVLTYDGAQKAIVLKQSTSSGGTTIYPYSAATTCTVGGLDSGSDIFNDEVVDIIQCMVSPTLFPALSNPSISSFTLSPPTTLYEVGAISDVCGVTAFNPGAINPQYPPTASSCRSNGTICYTYNAFGVPVQCIINSPSNIYPYGFNPIAAGNNIVSATVCHLGGTQPYDSSGVIYGSPLAISATTTCQRVVCGIYPWYYGVMCSGGAASGANRPSDCCIKDVITGGTVGAGCSCNKAVSTSTGTLDSVFCSTSDDYLWFATPVASTTKTWYYVSDLNQGAMGGAVSPGGNLFPNPDTVTDVTTVCWSGQSYKIYISNYQTSTMCCGGACCYNMELRNS